MMTAMRMIRFYKIKMNKQKKQELLKKRISWKVSVINPKNSPPVQVKGKYLI